MFAFDMLSDFHVEFNSNWEINIEYDELGKYYPWHLDKKSDVLVINGDCSNHPNVTVRIIKEAALQYDQVMFTDGNHEHYIGYTQTKHTVDVNNQLFEDLSAEVDNITYLNGTNSVMVDDTMFIGVNGWYDFTANHFMSREQQHDAWRIYSNDSKCIRFDKGGYPDKLAWAQAESLRHLVEGVQDDPQVKHIVVATHTIPHRRGMVSDTHQWGHLNGAYMNTLMQQVWIADEANKIKVWCYGHTHNRDDFDAEGIRFVNNARGYSMERKQEQFEGVVKLEVGPPVDPLS